MKMDHKTKSKGLSHGAIHGKRLDVSVNGCKNLTDKLWLSRQDPYVVVFYGNTKFQTRTHRNGGKNPMFNEKFMFPLVEGLRELTVEVWNKRPVSADVFIGSAIVHLDETLSVGYDDTPWVLKSRSGKTSGEVNMILRFGRISLKEEKDDHSSAHFPGYPPSGYSSSSQPGGYPAPSYAAAPAGYGGPHQAYPGFPPPSPMHPQYGSYHGSGHSGLYPPVGGAPGGYPPQNHPPAGYPASGYSSPYHGQGHE